MPISHFIYRLIRIFIVELLDLGRYVRHGRRFNDLNLQCIRDRIRRLIVSFEQIFAFLAKLLPEISKALSLGNKRNPADLFHRRDLVMQLLAHAVLDVGTEERLDLHHAVRIIGERIYIEYKQNKYAQDE
ncbi:hypothetical protein D3C77_367660 [compost metagenome]